MVVLHLASVLFSLLCFSAATPTTEDCSELTQPLTLEELHKIYGRWILIEGYGNHEILYTMLKYFESFLMVLKPSADNQILVLDQAQRVSSQYPKTEERGQCLRVVVHMNITDNKILDVYHPASRANHKFLQTCPDCLVMHSLAKDETTLTTYETIYLFGRNRTLASSDLETFRKQAACLQFPQHVPKFQYNDTELCSLEGNFLFPPQIAKSNETR